MENLSTKINVLSIFSKLWLEAYHGNATQIHKSIFVEKKTCVNIIFHFFHAFFMQFFYTKKCWTGSILFFERCLVHFFKYRKSWYRVFTRKKMITLLRNVFILNLTENVGQVKKILFFGRYGNHVHGCHKFIKEKNFTCLYLFYNSLGEKLSVFVSRNIIYGQEASI